MSGTGRGGAGTAAARGAHREHSAGEDGLQVLAEGAGGLRGAHLRPVIRHGSSDARDGTVSWGDCFALGLNLRRDDLLFCWAQAAIAQAREKEIQMESHRPLAADERKHNVVNFSSIEKMVNFSSIEKVVNFYLWRELSRSSCSLFHLSPAQP